MGTDVILFNPDTRFKKKIWIPNLPLSFVPMGLLAISGPLLKAGYQVKIIDQRIEPGWKKILLAELKKNPICIGISVMAGGPIVGFALEVSRIVRKNSKIPIVWGGVHPTFFPEQTIENPNIDIVVHREGEETFLEVVNAIRNKNPLDKIKGIYYKQDGEIKSTAFRPYVDLNKCPPYPYHLVNMRKYILQGPGYRIIDFNSSRGCPFNCSFCYHSYYDPGHWTALSAQETLDRVRHLRKDFGINGIRFVDDNFFVNMDRTVAILEGFIRERFNEPFHRIDIRADMLCEFNDDFLKFIENSGILSLFIGIESGSQRMLKLMNKEIDISRVIFTNKKISRFRIHPQYSFMVGLPSETKEDLLQTVNLYLRLIKENKRATGLFCIYVPRFGTELFNLSIKYGLKIPQSLQEWSYYPYTYSDPGNNKPWINSQRRNLLINLRFSSVGIFSARKYIYFSYSPILLFRYFFKIAAKLYFYLAKKRMKNFNFNLFIEKYIVDFIIGEY